MPLYLDLDVVHNIMNGLEAQISSIFRRFQRKERDSKLLAQYRHPHFSSLKMAKVREFHHYFLIDFMFYGVRIEVELFAQNRPPLSYDLSSNHNSSVEVSFSLSKSVFHHRVLSRLIQSLELWQFYSHDSPLSSNLSTGAGLHLST